MEFIRKYKSLFISLRSNIVRKKFSIQKTIVKWIKIVFLVVEIPLELVGDILFFWGRCFKKKFINPQKVLIVRIDQFGDVLFSTFLLPILKKKYPECEIDYLVNPKTSAILKNNQYIRNIYFWDEVALHFIAGRKEGSKTSIAQALKNNQEVIGKLKGENYDYVINGRAFVPSSNIWWKLIKPKHLISFDISEQSFLADYWAEYNLKDEEWENYMNLLLPLGISREDFFFGPVFENFDDSIFNRGELEELQNEPYIVCAPVSFDKDREWPKEYWRDVVAQYRNGGGIIVFTGIPSQRTYIEEIVNGIEQESVFIVTDATLPQLGSLYKKAKLLLCIDSFPTHLALAVKTKTICLINTSAYYLKGFSSPLSSMSARCMVPLLNEKISVFKTDTQPEVVLNKIKELVE
ncbi:glycosyltransferase family 9 protein [Candidatus Parcubacteria bacterium]|jgi:ADP-heptose:LPS heptosyltransferase|nr:MAG: glycosyltransferase family 9 protein [Candidatus Parcubacteria bacterium]